MAVRSALKISSITEDSQARQIGLEVGDIIIGYGSALVTNEEDFVKARQIHMEGGKEFEQIHVSKKGTHWIASYGVSSGKMGMQTSAHVVEEKLYKIFEDFNKNEEILMTTGESFCDFDTLQTVSVVTAEYAIKNDRIFMNDTFFGRTGGVERALKNANQKCLNDLKTEARMIGGNAIVSVKINQQEVSGNGETFYSVVAIGTAVRVVQNA